VEEASKVVGGLVRPARSSQGLERNKRGQAYVTPLPTPQDQRPDQWSPRSQAGRGEQMPRTAEHLGSSYHRSASRKGLGESERASGERIPGEQWPSADRRRRNRTSERRGDDATEPKEVAASPRLWTMPEASPRGGVKPFRVSRGSRRQMQTSGGVGGEDASPKQADEQGGGEPKASASWRDREGGLDESHRSDVEKEGRRRKRRTTAKGRAGDAEAAARSRAAHLDGEEEDIQTYEV
jgi:hypothetical protein